MRSPTHQDWPSSPPRVATRFKGESSQQGRRFAPLWAPSSSSPPHPIYDDNGVMWVPYRQSFYPGRGGSRRPALDQISRPTRDRWTPRQSGQGHQNHPVRLPPYRRSDRPAQKSSTFSEASLQAQDKRGEG
jgi:hypothetical protein